MAKRPIVVVPIAFVSEHSETLVELDIEYRKLADESGAPCYLRMPTVGADAAFVAGLADLVRVQHRRGTTCDSASPEIADGSARRRFRGASRDDCRCRSNYMSRGGALGQVPFLTANSTELLLLYSPRRRRRRSEHGRCASAITALC